MVKKLVIKFIPGAGSKYAYDSASGNEKPTFYFKDTSKTAGIDFKDREKLDINDASFTPSRHYLLIY